MLRIHLGSGRAVLEYAVPVWQDIPAYLSEAIERVQKRARVVSVAVCVWKLIPNNRE